MNERSPAPAGAMQEIRIELIDEGAFQQQVNRVLQRSVDELLKFEQEHEDKTGAIEIVAKIKISRLPNTTEFFRVATVVTTKVPTPKKMTVVKEAGGKLLCQPVGTNEDPNQQQFFDGRGRPINAQGQPGLIEQDGSPPVVAGRIPPQTAVG